jgi:hypothetical protein
MGSSGGSSQSADRSYTVKFAPYIASAYSNLLTTTATLSLALIEDSPYSDYSDQDTNTAIIGAGYTIANFPSLYDTFGSFMSGFDVEALWDKAFKVGEVEVAALGIAEISLADDKIDSSSIPNFSLSLRDINAVSSSSFVIGKSVIENRRIKTFANIHATATLNNINYVSSRYNTYLNFKKSLVDEYSELIKIYEMLSVQAVEANTTMSANNSFWPFTVFDFQRAVLGTMRQGAGYVKTGLVRKRSDISKVLFVSSYTVNGVMLGSMIGGPFGAVVGGVVGFVVGVASMLFE